MIRTSASQFKAKLGRFMRAVREGKEVIVTDRNQPIARLVPFREASQESGRLGTCEPRDPSAPPLGKVEVRGIRYRGPDTTELIRADRDRR